jgi:ATP-dependent DNA helicase RecQ
LKALEQEGWIAFNEQVFLPPRVGFIVGKDELYDFEKNNPSFEPLIKTLLRSYEGIFDQSVVVSEKMIAVWLKNDVAEIIRQLNILDQAGIIEYASQKDKPQLLLLRDRIKPEDIHIDMSAYSKRKQDAISRIERIIDFAKEKHDCRSRFIGNYFGDSAIKACGICDNCIERRSTPISKEEFDTLHHRIINIIKYESLQARDLFVKLNNVKKQKAMQVLDFLQAENKIQIDAAGWIRLV